MKPGSRKWNYGQGAQGNFSGSVQYRYTNIPTITWQKRGDDFIVADYNITMKIFTDGLIGNFLDRPASSIYEDRPDIQA